MWLRSIILLLLCHLIIWEYIPISIAGEATLLWDSPATSYLPDLGGYKVYYGTSSGVYNSVTDVGNVTTWDVTNLSDGRAFYFAVTAYDIQGNESDFSNEVIKTTGGLLSGNIDTSTPPSVNRVDGYDLISLEMSMGATPVSANWNPAADLDGNGRIDQQDLGILIGNFGAIK